MVKILAKQNGLALGRLFGGRLFKRMFVRKNVCSMNIHLKKN